jgi:nucleoside-diphosphate-sugar epimerase
MYSTILLTGATGYLGANILRILLDRGYKVHFTTRNIEKTTSEEWLSALNTQFPDKISFFEADLETPGAFDKALEGVDAVIHAASPFRVQGIKNTKKELLEPAVNGTKHLLNALDHFPQVKKVVLTSSIASIYCDAADIDDYPEEQFTEQHWNTGASLTHQPYSYSKVSAERAAWTINEGKPWKLITINPGFILGPSIAKRSDSTSIRFMIDMLSGKFKVGVPNISFCVVDVRDVALAHVLALESEEASGRHICTNKTLTTLEIAGLVKELTPKNKSKIPTRTLPKLLTYIFAPILAGFSWRYLNRNLGRRLNFDNSKIKTSLKIQFRPVEETIKDQIDQLIKDGFVK